MKNRIKTESSWYRWGLRVLIAVAVSLWLISIAGGVVVVCAFPRFLPAANRLRQQIADEANRQEARPSNEELIRVQSILIFGAGEAILAIAVLGTVSSLAMLTTVVAMSLDRRFASRQINASLVEISKKLRELQETKNSGAVTAHKTPESGEQEIAHEITTKPSQAKRTFLWIILAGGIVSAIAFTCSRIVEHAEKQRWLQQDSLLVQQMTKNSSGSVAPPKPRENFALPSVGLHMIWVEAGSFSMGGDGLFDGRPITKVTLTRGFWLGKYELKQEEYRAVMHVYPKGVQRGSDMPAANVSWYIAIEFCRKLTDLTRAAGRLPEGYAFTLPTEAQWEYACRAGTTGEYAGDISEMAWYSRDHNGENVIPWFGGPRMHGEHPVGEKKPNAWGFYDMHGNMSEWCLDWYAFKLPGGSVTNPAGPVSGEFRVKRGGSWTRSAPECSSAARVGTSPNHSATEGFRVALSQVSRP